MAEFIGRYVANNGKGVQEIVLTAETKSDALSQLRAKGRPISVDEKETSSTEITLFEAKRIKTKDISLFCKQMSVMIDAGIPLNNAVDILAQQTDSKLLKTSLKQIGRELKEGSQLSTAMLNQGDKFPNLLIRMIQAGEKTGKLDEVLEKMSVHYTKEVKINGQIKGAMIYPAVLGVLAFVAVLVLLYVVIPNFIGIFESSGTQLPLITRVVIAMSDFVRNYWYILFAVIGILVFAFLQFRKSETGRRQLDSMKLAAPVLKGPNQKIVTARFASTLATLTSAGIPLVDALEAAASTTNNVTVMDQIAIANEGIQQGRNLTEMLVATNLFPPMMISMVKIGEESGSLEAMLTKTSAFYEEELEVAIKQLLSMMEPALIMVMGLVIGGIVAAVMLPMFEIASAVNAGAQ